ncbi:sugar isomerase domain-containing protein [Schumannella sp. 10F1B-5-1]|uniref:sugar isomerase domain-containing protein n=1 Tax=Schumannella sp. 10F1B-5-1 TaxID=2590780 RepID=UPI001130FC9B|nr:SIS domain-containing protein [Schumannella sp. 10F1B-5-1]TPW73137.1 SIS domain-containing protein [Schumannella sp. 10F1B-5-1]
MTDSAHAYLDQVVPRLQKLTELASSGGLDAAVDLLVAAVEKGAVVQSFGTGHSQAFVMELSGRAGGLIPTSGIYLRDVLTVGDRDRSQLTGGELERDPSVVDDLFSVSTIGPDDVFVIASNSGVNGSIVGVALEAKRRGHPVIAVTSLEHTNAVEPKHPSGQRLSEIADVVIDNLAPYGDTTMEIEGGIGVGAVSSITAALVAQLLTIAVAERIAATGTTPPVYISANIPGGDEHNRALEDRYRGRIRRSA